MGWNGVSYQEDRLDFLKITVRDRMCRLFEGVEEADDIKMFVKQEPHKQAKIEEERYRLISAVSLVDTMIDRFLLEPLQKQVVKTCLLTPVVAGLNVMCGGHYVVRSMLGHHDKYLSLDKSAWDWSVPGWMIDALEKVIIELNPGAPDWWLAIYKMRNHLLFNKCVYRFKDGTRAYQEGKGVMKSGCYGTLLYNSVSQLILELVAREATGIEAPLPLILGDDSISGLYENYEVVLSAMSRFGFVVKVQILDDPEFIGFHFYKDGFTPAYQGKHRFRLQHLTLDKAVAASTLQGYQLLYYNHPLALNSIRNLALERDLQEAVMTDLSLLKIADGM